VVTTAISRAAQAPRHRAAAPPTLVRQAQARRPAPPLVLPSEVTLGNGIGGFIDEGRTYVMGLEDAETPMPW
jgi:hypothetical protein